MKKKHFLWLAVIFLVFGVLITFVFGFRPLDSTKAPKIAFDERVYDFGVVEPEDKPHHYFTFKNTGQVDLVISKVKSSCGCTAALLSEEQIPPGELGKIEIKFDPRGRRGKQQKTVSIHSNAENESVIQLTIQGVVKASVEVAPEQIFFGSVNNQEVYEKRIRVLGAGDGKLKITHVETSSAFLTGEISPPQLGEIITYEVKIVLHSGAPVGKLEETLTIHTNNETRPRLNVSIEGNVLGPISVHPEQLFLGFINAGEVIQRDILLTKMGQADMKVSEVNHQSPFVSTEVVPVENGRKVRIRVRLDENTPIGAFRDILEIHTNNREQSAVRVPLHALVRE